jgi:hypothetical protein
MTGPAQPEQENQNRLLWSGFDKFFDRVTPWLFDVGLWIFGSLMAFNLLILASLFTIGPVDRAVTTATAAFALALPLDVTGLLLLRLVRELTDVKFEDELANAFQQVGYTGGGQVPAAPALEAMRRRRAKLVLWTFPIVLALSVLLTLTGLLATLWHMAWWIMLAFACMIILSLLIIVLVVAGSRREGSSDRGLKQFDGIA